MTTKRKYNVVITNWNDSTVEFCKSKGGNPGDKLIEEKMIIKSEKYLYLHNDDALFSSNIEPHSFEIECDWLTEPDLVKALVCETDDDVARKHCLIAGNNSKYLALCEGLIGKELFEYRKATLQETLDYFRKDKKEVEPIGVEDRKKAEINPKRMTRREFYEAISNPNEAYKQHLKMLWDNNDAKSIFEITGLNVAGMLNAKNNDIIEGKTEAKTEEKPKREPDGYICPIDIPEHNIEEGSIFVKFSEEGIYQFKRVNEIDPYVYLPGSLLKAFFTPIYEQTIEENIKDKLANFLLQKLSKEDFVNEIKELFNK